MAKNDCEYIKNELGLDVALSYHLQYNHYPSIPLICMSSAKEAIENASFGDYESEVKLPNGLTYKGHDTAPTRAIIEEWHLQTFIDEIL